MRKFGRFNEFEDDVKKLLYSETHPVVERMKEFKNYLTNALKRHTNCKGEHTLLGVKWSCADIVRFELGLETPIEKLKLFEGRVTDSYAKQQEKLSGATTSFSKEKVGGKKK